MTNMSRIFITYPGRKQFSMFKNCLNTLQLCFHKRIVFQTFFFSEAWPLVIGEIGAWKLDLLNELGHRYKNVYI